jgi:hypothetical protein
VRHQSFQLSVRNFTNDYTESNERENNSRPFVSILFQLATLYSDKGEQRHNKQPCTWLVDTRSHSATTNVPSSLDIQILVHQYPISISDA